MQGRIEKLVQVARDGMLIGIEHIDPSKRAAYLRRVEVECAYFEGLLRGTIRVASVCN